MTQAYFKVLGHARECVEEGWLDIATPAKEQT